MTNQDKSPGYVETEVYGPCANCGYPRTAHEWKLPGRHCKSYMSSNPHPPVIDTTLEETSEVKDSYESTVARMTAQQEAYKSHEWRLKKGWKAYYECRACYVTDVDPKAWVICAARLSHPEIASHSNSPTCPLPLHNPLRQKDGTYKCSGCDKTWSEYPTVTVVWPKARTK